MGFKDIAEAEAYQKQQEAKAAERFTPTEKGWTEDFGLKFRETLGGSLPYMAAPVAAGAAALAAPVSAPVAAGLGLLGAGAVSTGQFTGSNIARQMDEGKSLQEASLGKAVGAAVPQALLDTAAMALLPGVGKLFGSVGSRLTNEQAKAIASQTLGKTVADYVAKTGTAMTREGLTEATQQSLERLQAGLQITDPEARKEYIESFIGGAVLGGAVAPFGRAFERGSAKSQAREAQRLETEAAAKVEAQRAEEAKQQLAVERTKPEYLTDLQTRYDALVKQEKELEEKTKVKPEGTDPASKRFAAEQKKLAVQELKDFRASPEYEALVQERVEAMPLLRKVEAEKKATEAVFGKEPTYEAEDTSDIGQATQLKARIDDLKKKQAGLTPAQQQPLQNQINALESTLETIVPDADVYKAAKAQLQTTIDKTQQQLVDATNTEQEQAILANLNRVETALKELQKFQPFIKTTTQMPSVSDLRDKMDVAKANGDVDAIRRLVPQLAEAEKQTELPFRTGVMSDNELANEIATAREEAKRRSETVAKETDALFRMGEKGLTDFEVGLRKARLDEAREIIRQASKPASERVKLAQPYRVQPGGKLNLATRASMLVRENEQDWASFDKEAKENAFRVADREKLRDQLKDKLKALEADYNALSKYGPSKALELVRTETETLEATLAQVERKLKIGRDKAVREPDATTQITQASDARVAELIDRLLPFATGAKPKTADEAKAKQAQQKRQELGQASLFDVEAQKELAANIPTGEREGRRVQFDEEGFKVKDTTAPAPAKPAAQKASVAPIEQAADLVDRARELRARLAEYNAQIQKAGRPSDPEKLARLNDLKDLRGSTLDELDNVQKTYADLTERQTPLFEAEENVPGTADLFGGLEKARGTANRIQRELDALYKERDDIRAGMQRRGQAGATPQLQALAEQYSKETPRLRQVEEQIEETEARLQEASGRRSERFDEFAQARERERVAQEDSRTRTLPGFERRAGLKAVDPAKLQDAKQRLVSLKNVEEDLRKARASGDADPTRYLRYVAALKNEQYEAFLVQSNDPIIKTWPVKKTIVLSTRYPDRIEATARDLERNDALRKEINYLNNLVKGKKTKVAENALQDNLQQQEKVRAEIADLERRQRAYEQQEAVREGAAPGAAEAERLIAGEGYRTPSGKVRTMPKKLSSWGIKKIDKKTPEPVPVAKVAASSRMLRAYQQEVQAQAEGKTAEKETLEKQIARATKNIENMNAALKQVYPDSVAKDVETEIEKLLASGLEPAQLQQVENMDQTYAALKTTTAGNTIGDVLARLNAEREKLLATQGRFTARRGSIFDEKEQKTVSFTVDQQLQDIAALIRELQKEQSKKQDAWTTAFNALIKEKNSNALIASQELGFADLEIASVKRKLDEMLDGTQKQIAATEKLPDSASKTATLAELNTALERQSSLLPITPGEVSNITEMKLSDWARRYGFGAYNALLDAYNKAAADLDQYQFAYKKARLEQLGLTRAYGNDIKAVIDTEVANIQKLTPQLADKAKENAEAAARLKKANQALASAKIAEREEVAKKPQDELAGFRYSADERAALARIREGLGLRGTRYESDTTSSLVVKTRKVVRDTLNLRQAELDKAQAQDNVAEVQRLTPIVKQLERDYESVTQLGERVITPVGEGAEDRTAERVQPLAEPGTRLGRQRVGPVARVGTQPPSQMLSGTAESREAISKGNRPMQTGAVRLMASDMNMVDANSVSLAVLKQKMDAATGDRKAELKAAFDAATDGMTDAQVKEKIKEGEDLIKLPGAASVVAARERVRAAEIAFEKAKADYREAKTPAAKELALDAVNEANDAFRRAEVLLDDAKFNVSAGLVSNKSAKEQAEEAIEDAVRIVAKPGKEEADVELERAEQSGRRGIRDEGSFDVATVYSTYNRTEVNPAVKDAILDGRFVEAVERLAVDSDNPLIRETANDIRRLLTRTKVVTSTDITLDGTPVPALFIPAKNTVVMRPDAIYEEDLIHEAVHAVTIQVLRTPDDKLTPQQRNAKREITAIFKQLEKRRDLKTEYGISDVEEFVSEMQSNVEFRAAVDKQPWYKRFWHALTRLWSNAPIAKISDQASALVKELYLPSTNVTQGKQAVASIFRREAPPASTIVGNEPGKLATLKGNLFGLAGRVQYFDRLGAAEKGIVAAEGAGKLSSTEAFNAQYFMRMGDKVTQAAGQFITDGPVRIVADKVGNATEYRYESTAGANLVKVSNALERGAKAGGMNPQEAETMLTVLIAGQRANAVPNGWERLQGKDPAGAKAEYNMYVNKMNANPAVKSAMEEAMREYKTYNEGLLNFAAQTGYLSKDEVRRLNKQPYVPFYRVEDGNVKLFVLGERPITIGNIKDNPDLQQFLGDEKKIQPILTSAVQNTFMLTRMAMHNKATMETTNALYKAGFVSKMGRGAGLANPSTVHYKIDGEDRFAVIDADTFGIPAELIVRGMEGIKTTIPSIVKMMGIPADILRKFITRSPAYIVRQLVREPVNAFIVSGVDGVPVANALRELAKMQAGRSPAELALMRGLVVSSNIYTGGEADMQKFLNDVAAGRGGWDKFLGKLDTMALQVDTATRAAIYNDAIKKGFSEAQAQFRTMESANFGRRGLSSSMQMMSTLVPFFNAQIQGLDVLYRTIKGDMPFNQQLEIQRKIAARGAMLFASSLAYAFMMQDDEDYQKAKPEERYSNFFVNIPGVKDPLKIPFPFEVGLLFMGLPQAIVDVAMGNATGKEAAKAIGKLMLNSAPGVVPAAPKPIIEAFYGETTFGPIESAREKLLEAGARFRPGTTELAKTLGSVTGEVGISPLMIEHFVRGYTGGLGVALMSTLNPLLRDPAEGEKMPVGASRQPFIGGLFQPSEGRFLIERAYGRMEDVISAQATYKDLVNRGQQDRALAYAKENAALIVGAPMAGAFRQRMGELFDMERKIIANPKLSGEEKEAKVQQLKDMQNRMALQFYAATERTTPR
ncbi:MAG: LPD38 domain-containing protein [Pseudomonadota bacterium]